jgi:hypothetical protein
VDFLAKLGVKYRREPYLGLSSLLLADSMFMQRFLVSTFYFLCIKKKKKEAF